MTDLCKAAETLLKALEEDEPLRYATRWDGFLKDEVQALRQALAQPEPEDGFAVYQRGFEAGKALTQREWVGLTDEEIVQCYIHADFNDHYKAIEAKLKEKNT